MQQNNVRKQATLSDAVLIWAHAQLASHMTHVASSALTFLFCFSSEAVQHPAQQHSVGTILQQ
jgi:hypothetical protein